MALGNLTDFVSINSQLESMLQANPWLVPLIVAVLIWKLVWYGIAIYKSVERKQKAWFVVLFVCAFVLNDLGLLPILYLIFNREKKIAERQKAKRKKK